VTFDLAFVDSIGAVYDSITDTFTRTVASGWGSADTGQAWTTSGGSASDYSTTGTQGRHLLATANVSRFTGLSVGGADVNAYAEITVPAVATGAAYASGLLGRFDLGSLDYVSAQLIFNATGNVDLRITKNYLGSVTTLASLVGFDTYAASTFAVRLSVRGPNLYAKAWKTTGGEPAAWQLFYTDPLTTAGTSVGFRSKSDAGSTNAGLAIQMDNLTATSPTRLRLNLNDDINIRTLADGTDFGVPELDRAYADTLLVDGAIVPAAAYGNRWLTLALRFQRAPDLDANAALLQSVIRELDRPSNFLRYQAGTSSPLFFRTLRSSASSITWDPVSQEARIPILAEPFAHGQRVDLAPVTVNNDPAAVSNGMYWDVTGVTGDVETPPLIRITNSAPFSVGALSSVIGIRRHGTPANMPLVLQCEAMTLGTDTTLPGNDATMSGSGSNYARCSFATNASMAERLTIANFPPSALIDARGRYRVWLRNRQSIGGDVFAVRLTYGAPGVTSNIINDTVTLFSDTNRRWTDLGDFTVPLFADPVEDGPSGVQMPPVGLGLAVQAQRVSGAGTFDMDSLLLVPADDGEYASIRWSIVGAQPPAYLVLDSVHDLIYPMDGGGLMHSNNQGITRSGGLPMLSPNQTNRLVMIMNATPASTFSQIDSITHTATVAVSFWPRYASVARPVAS
jgi:hypothetical protein